MRRIEGRKFGVAREEGPSVRGAGRRKKETGSS